jgi:hypothetical protein
MSSDERPLLTFSLAAIIVVAARGISMQETAKQVFTPIVK